MAPWSPRGRRCAIPVLLGTALIGFGATLVGARDDGIYEVIFSDRARERPALTPAAPPGPRGSIGTLRRPRAQTARGNGSSRRGTEVTSGFDGRSERSVCVRMCDGYYFPIGNLSDEDDRPAHEALCEATCPGAPVKLFTLAAGHRDIGDARAGPQTYRELPMAYAHQRSRDPTCSCRRESTSARVSILRDFTLRKGDIIVGDGQLKVFEGAKRWPYAAQDFADYRKGAEAGKRDRGAVDRIVSDLQYRGRQSAQRAASARHAAPEPESTGSTKPPPTGATGVRVIYSTSVPEP